jgi:hypothetical protein
MQDTRVTTEGNCLFFSVVATTNELSYYVNQFMLTGAIRCQCYKQ